MCDNRFIKPLSFHKTSILDLQNSLGNIGHFLWKSASSTSTNVMGKPYGMKCISCAISYSVFKVFTKFPMFWHSMRSSESAESTLSPLDTSTSSARATLELRCSCATAYYFWTVYGPQMENSWHSNVSKNLYQLQSWPAIFMMTGIFISAFPSHFSIVTVTVSTAYSKYVNVKGKKKKDCATWKQIHSQVETTSKNWWFFRCQPYNLYLTKILSTII